jgi:hypothetical protein
MFGLQGFNVSFRGVGYYENVRRIEAALFFFFFFY